jgi:hypothetical protein
LRAYIQSGTASTLGVQGFSRFLIFFDRRQSFDNKLDIEDIPAANYLLDDPAGFDLLRLSLPGHNHRWV